ncbi:MAG: hypothetical protein ACREFQ_17835 [Stellaceae bacterium]
MILPAIAAASAVLIAAGGSVQITEAQLEAAHYGRILGAAAQCSSIDRHRVSDATHHASLAVRALVSSSQQFEAARGSFDNAALDGRAGVSQGQESCAAADHDLKEIEIKFGGGK